MNDATIITIFLVCLGAMAALTLTLVLRDWRQARAERENPSPENLDGLRRLPTPVDDSNSGGFTDRIDLSFRRLVFQTGLDVSAEAAFLLMVLSGLAIGGTVFVWRDNPIEGTVAFTLGMVLPLMYFVWQRSRRLASIRQQLPDVMDLMARSVRAGESLDQAIAGVGKGCNAPLGLEFQRCAKQLDMGLAMPAAMKSLTYRAPITEMRILAATFNVQRRAGGNVAVNLDRLAHVIRDRLSYQRQFMAATGASRLATTMIAVAGPAVFLFMMFSQPDYMGAFFLQPGGYTLLTIAGTLQAVGLVWVLGLLRNQY